MHAGNGCSDQGPAQDTGYQKFCLEEEPERSRTVRTFKSMLGRRFCSGSIGIKTDPRTARIRLQLVSDGRVLYRCKKQWRSPGSCPKIGSNSEEWAFDCWLQERKRRDAEEAERRRLEEEATDREGEGVGIPSLADVVSGSEA